MGLNRLIVAGIVSRSGAIRHQQSMCIRVSICISKSSSDNNHMEIYIVQESEEVLESAALTQSQAWCQATCEFP